MSVIVLGSSWFVAMARVWERDMMGVGSKMESQNLAGQARGFEGYRVPIGSLE